MENSAITSEAAHAWNHYRHMEETRRNYLAFQMVTTLTALGFLAGFVKDASSADRFLLSVAFTLFLIFLFFFSFLIWANILRIGYILHAYSDILRKSREHTLADNDEMRALWQIRNRIPTCISGGIFAIQHSANYLTMASCIAILIAQICVSVLVYFMPHVDSIHKFLMCLPPIAMAGALFYAGEIIEKAARQRATIDSRLTSNSSTRRAELCEDATPNPDTSDQRGDGCEPKPLVNS